MAATVCPPAENTRGAIPRGFAARIFSFPVMCYFLLGAVIFGFCVRQIAEPDIWWHLRYAQELFQNHAFSRVDTFSFTAAGSYRPNFEWLSEVAYYLAFRAANLQGVLTLYFVLLLTIFAGVYYRTCKAGDDCKNATLATLIGIFLGVVSIGPRTLLFGWLCMVGLLLVLDHFRNKRKGAWLLPPLFAVWVNLHPSWAFGMIVLVLTIASGLVEGTWSVVEARRWTGGELRKLLLGLGSSIAALFVNPFGYKVVLYPFDFVFRQQSNVQHVAEWQAVDFSTGNGKFTIAVLLGLLASILVSRRRWRLDEVLLITFALWTALSHTRFLFFLGLVLPPVLAQRLSLFPPYDPEIDKPWLNAGIIAVLLGALFLFFPSNAQLWQKVANDYPVAALDFMQRQNLTGKVFNQYVWGGYMDWNTRELKPFIDGRADIFVYNGAFDDYMKTSGIQDPLETLDRYQIDYVLQQPDRPLTYLLEHSPKWQVAYADKVAVVFARVPADSPSGPQSN
jgi:hypothetical protein